MPPQKKHDNWWRNLVDRFPLNFPLNCRRGSRAERRAFGVIMDAEVAVSGTETNLCSRFSLNSPAQSPKMSFLAISIQLKVQSMNVLHAFNGGGVLILLNFVHQTPERKALTE